jgi:hypothetical protein
MIKKNFFFYKYFREVVDKNPNVKFDDIADLDVAKDIL